MSSFKHLLSKKTWKILSYHGSFHVFDRWLIYSCCVSLERQLHSNTDVKMIIYWLRWKWRDANDRKLLRPDEKYIPFTLTNKIYYLGTSSCSQDNFLPYLPSAHKTFYLFLLNKFCYSTQVSLVIFCRHRIILHCQEHLS